LALPKKYNKSLAMYIFKKTRKQFQNLKDYSVNNRDPFFYKAVEHLDAGIDSTIVDIGPGNGSFLDSTKIHDRYSNTYLLDSNPETVNALRKKFSSVKVLEYSLPDKMPFTDRSVSFVHLSHIVEHLYPNELYAAIKEIDRVLKPDGLLVISTPLMWDRFWDDLSHIRPYSPVVFRNYLVTGRDNATGSIISTNYEEIDFTYRYRATELVQISSQYFFFYTFFKLLNRFLTLLGFRRYIKNGYTIVLQKGE